MIKLQNMTPKVYYNHSRDFQFIGRLYDIVLNYIKTNTDIINNIHSVDNINNDLLSLWAMAAGFKSIHEYNVDQLRALCSTFQYIVRKKGTLESLRLIRKAILKVEGIIETDKTVDIEYDPNDKNNLIVYLPQNLSDTNLLQDVLNYILPAGMTCEFVKELSEKMEALTELSTNDSIEWWLDDNNIKAVIPGNSTLISNPVRATNEPGMFVNYVIIQKPGDNGSGSKKYPNEETIRNE